MHGNLFLSECRYNGVLILNRVVVSHCVASLSGDYAAVVLACGLATLYCFRKRHFARDMLDLGWVVAIECPGKNSAF